MNTPRTLVVAIDLPEVVEDITLARRVQAVLRRTCIASPDQTDLLWPDPASIEVTVFRLPATALLCIGDPS